MRKDLHVYYSALGLNPGASATEIRRAYLQLIQRWHPDHFKAGSYMHTTAEDTTKELNEAYEQLFKKQLYKRFLHRAGPKKPPPEPAANPADRARQAYGNAAETRQNTPGSVPSAPPRTERPASRPAPPVSPAPPKPPVSPEPPRAKTSERRRAPRPDSDGPRSKPPQSPSKTNFEKFRRWAWGKIAVTAGLVVAGFAIRQTMPERYAGNPATTIASAEYRLADQPAQPQAKAILATAEQIQTTAAEIQDHPNSSPAIPKTTEAILTPADIRSSLGLQAAEDTPAITPPATDWAKVLDEAKAQMDTFRMGDNKAKVISIQGVPDDASDAVFRYGSSIVYFKEGLVTGWSDGFPQLRIRKREEMGFDLLNTFSVGSSRAEVFRAQGKPTGLTPGSYYYGSSAVYFENDRVTSWLQVDQSLSTLVIPTMPSVDLNKLLGR